LYIFPALGGQEHALHARWAYGVLSTKFRKRGDAPIWTGINSLPLKGMWPDDEYWLPKVLAGERVRAAFLFDENESMPDRYVKVLGEGVGTE